MATVFHTTFWAAHLQSPSPGEPHRERALIETIQIVCAARSATFSAGGVEHTWRALGWAKEISYGILI